MFRRAALAIGKMRGKNYSIFEEEAFTDLQPDFKFICYGAYPSEKAAIGIDFMRQVERILKENGDFSFECHFRFSDQRSPRWDDSFLRSNISLGV